MIENFVELDDRVLRFDGVSVLEPEQVQRFFLLGVAPSEIRVTELSDEIQAFNRLVLAADVISAENEELSELSTGWRLPQKYLELDTEEHVLAVFRERLPGLAYTSIETELAVARVAEELAEYQIRGLQNLLRVVIYILDTFREQSQVYGVGRGSSCASYVLFLLGLHVVDSIKFQVPLQEFFHD